MTPAPAPPGTLARLRTKDQWLADSTIASTSLFKKKPKRPEGLEQIDAAVAAYEPMGDLDTHMKDRDYEDGLDLEARKLLGTRDDKLSNINQAIGVWKKSRKPSAKGWTEVEALATEVALERKKTSDVIGRWEQAALRVKAEARGQKMDLLIPKDLNTKQGADAKARELFRIFMQFRGQVRYRTSSKTQFWESQAAPMACGTFADGFRDFLIRAGLKAQTVAITNANFITVPIGDTFIDAQSNGNLSTPEQSLAQVRRFFFSVHYVVAVDGGPHFCPTSGHVTDAAGANIVDPEADYRGFAADKNGGYQNDRYTVSKVGEIAEGSEYQLKPRTGK